ncbi:cell division protein ZipA [Candidatus Endobugula sertula]|uniref:Cell division protein ZipA n=1 Tax=Candidatus Endobugula sertula TaxID=62101 RepID=A0A1D2QNZ7_9GAMM|nr:cell division protein ZipA [Candidatus Endobugula sertula]
MDFSTQTWLIVLVFLLIIGIFLDGFRRMRKARYDSLRMSLDTKKQLLEPVDDNHYGSEFPNGGARASDRKIDKERIAKIRSQYDFGTDLTGTSQSDKTTEADDEDPWVDNDEGGEEYYGKTWDDEYDFDSDVKADASDIDHDHNEVLENPNEAELEAEVTNHGGNATKTVEDGDLEAEHKNSTVNNEPEQVSLNLEEAVPVLMETAEADALSKTTGHTSKTKRKVPSDKGRDILLESHALDSDLEIRPVGKRIKRAIEPTLDDSGELESRSANKPHYQSKYFSRESQHTTDIDSSLQEVLILHIKASGDQQFSGSDILQQAVENGLRYGAMDIFHYHADENGEGPALFSMANMLMPGVFDLKTIDRFSTVGITFFLVLPVAGNENMLAFETMVETAKNIAAGLSGELKDEQRSVMTAQTIAHYRERVRDFARRQQLEKSKP